MVALPERCCTTLSALRSAVSIARALPDRRIRSEPAGTDAPSSVSSSISIAGSSARKKASASGRPATTIASRLSITPEKRAAAGITLSAVTSCPPPGRPTPRSSSSVERTNCARAKPSSRQVITNPVRPEPVEGQPCSLAPALSERQPFDKLRANGSGLGWSVHEPRDDVPVGPTHFHLGVALQHQEALAVGVRLDLADLVEVHDGRAVHPLEHPRVEPALEVLHRFAQDQRIVAGVDAHVVAGAPPPPAP